MEINSKYLSIFCIIIAQAFFTTLDMAIKFLSGDYALHQITLIRAIVAILFTLLVLVPIDGGYNSLLSKRIGLHLIRGFGIVVANLCFFSALVTIPLAETTSIFFIASMLLAPSSLLVEFPLFNSFSILALVPRGLGQESVTWGPQNKICK